MSHYTIPETVLTQEVDGELVLLDLAGEGYHSLNAVGTRIWHLLTEGHAAEAIIERLFDQYEVSRAQLAADVTALIAELLEAGLLKQAGDD